MVGVPPAPIIRVIADADLMVKESVDYDRLIALFLTPNVSQLFVHVVHHCFSFLLFYIDKTG